MIYMKITLLCLISVCVLAIFGCNLQWNAGDIIIGSTHGSTISTKLMPAVANEMLYGVVLQGPGGTSVRTQRLILSVYVVPPENEKWTYGGGGSVAPWYYRFYNPRWVHLPLINFVKPKENGDKTGELHSKRFIFEFDGRNRSVEIAGKTFPISIGDVIFVKLDKNWKPNVAIGIEALDSLSISTRAQQEIRKHMVGIDKQLGSG